jgi:hypothetical protein
MPNFIWANIDGWQLLGHFLGCLAAAWCFALCIAEAGNA